MGGVSAWGTQDGALEKDPVVVPHARASVMLVGAAAHLLLRLRDVLDAISCLTER